MTGKEKAVVVGAAVAIVVILVAWAAQLGP